MTRFSSRNYWIILVACVLLPACDSGTDNFPVDNDAQLQARIEAAMASASDLPPTLQVEVNGGRVVISGSLLCEDCGGNSTPGNAGTIQQSLGAVVRAVPGVTEVEFALTTVP